MKQELQDIFNILQESGVPTALIGGLAVSARVEPRFTRDIDLAIAVKSDSAAEELLRLCISKQYQLLNSTEQLATRRLATARLLPSKNTEEEIVLDLLFASSGIEKEICELAEGIEIFPNLSIPIARSGHLIACKLLSCDEISRPQDILDLRGLFTVATKAELVLAEESIELISARKFNRGRDLPALFEKFSSLYSATAN